MGITVCPGPNTNELCFALKLTGLRASKVSSTQALSREFVALISALEGQRDARFVLQTMAWPTLTLDDPGRLEIHLVTVVSGRDNALPTRERIDELADDLLDLLSAPPVRWFFEPVSSSEALAAVLTPIDAVFHAEVARREEPVMPTHWESSIGFSGHASRGEPVRPLWSMWTFGAAAEDSRRLFSVLLAQEAPVCIRVSLTPTELMASERDLLEQLATGVSQVIHDRGLHAASLRTLESLLFLRPVFDVRMIIASTQRLSRSLLSAVGHAVSEPTTHGAAPADALAGGSAIIRAGDLDDSAVLDEAFRTLSAGRPVPSLAPPGLERLRRLLGAWEAANLFRLPVSEGDAVSGLPVLRVPDVDPGLDRLPTTGQRLGHVLGAQRTVLIDTEERFRHLYISGQTGTGKSTLLLSLAMQDIAAGNGVAVFDPHGDLVEAILARIPDGRIDDVVLVDPADPEAVVGVNLLEAETPAQAAFIIAELAEMFYALFDPQRQGIVGPRFESLLRQAALLLLAHPDQPSSFLDISTLFVDDAVRRHLAEGITDPVLSEFWQGEYPMLVGTSHHAELVSWFRSKFEVFRTSPMVRNVVGQAKSSISFSEILREKRILLINLSKGALGEYNSSLIGHIVFARLWGASLERSALTRDKRPDFFVYIDEFQNITNDSLPDVLSEARKFRVGLTLANQFFEQIPERTRAAIMGNASSRVAFRIGPQDAVPFSTWLGRGIVPDDLTSLSNYTAVTALCRDGVPLDPVVMRTESPPGTDDLERAALVRERSRTNWARPVAELDQEFFNRWSHVPQSISARMLEKRNLAATPPDPDPRIDPTGNDTLADLLAQEAEHYSSIHGNADADADADAEPDDDCALVTFDMSNLGTVSDSRTLVTALPTTEGIDVFDRPDAPQSVVLIVETSNVVGLLERWSRHARLTDATMLDLGTWVAARLLARRDDADTYLLVDAAPKLLRRPLAYIAGLSLRDAETFLYENAKNEPLQLQRCRALSFAFIVRDLGGIAGVGATVEESRHEIDLARLGSIKFSELSDRPSACLHRVGINTYEQLAQCTDLDLLQISMFGQKSLDEVQYLLNEREIELSSNYTNKEGWLVEGELQRLDVLGPDDYESLIDHLVRRVNELLIEVLYDDDDVNAEQYHAARRAASDGYVTLVRFLEEHLPQHVKSIRTIAGDAVLEVGRSAHLIVNALRD